MSENNKYKINGEIAHPKRVPLHLQKILSADTDKNYRYYICNDEPGRIESFKLAGWGIVHKESDNRDKRVQEATSTGSAMTYVVNKDPAAKSHIAYLMRIPAHIYDEDYKAQQELVDERIGSLDPKISKQRGADYGTFDISNKE